LVLERGGAVRVLEVDPGLLDAPEALADADRGDMLRQIASGAAQVRQAQRDSIEAGIERLADWGRPRAVVVAGMGTAGIAGDILAAVCGVGCPVPISTVRGHQLPGWVGAPDLVVAVSRSGATEETVAVAVEAARRGCHLVCVAAEDSPLAGIAEQVRAPFVPVRSAARSRAAVWALAVPPLLTARTVGLVDLPAELLEHVASKLEEVSHQCRPASESFVNPAKQTALEIAGTVPMIWGTSPLAATAAHRLASQLAANAKYPAVWGELPEALHDQIVTLDGSFRGDDDIFRDRVEEPEITGLRLLIIRDVEEHPRVRERCEAAAELARERAVPVTELTAQAGHPLERLAGLIAHADYASVYLALAAGTDPASADVLRQLKARIT
jgi:glucose/mannose-6-phosphate isomerase